MSLIRRPPNVPGSIGLLVLSTNPSGSAWNTIHDPPVMGSYGMNESLDVGTYNGYALAPPYSRARNSTNLPYAQQPLVTAIGRPTYMHANQNICP